MDPNDLVPPVPDEESVWDAGLNAVYGEEEPSQDADSILGALEERTGASSRITLPDAPETDGRPSVFTSATDSERMVGRYLVMGEVARGGMGVVLKGRDPDLGRDVAMKVLKTEYADNRQMVQRFIEEAQIGGQLQHPGIVPVYDMGLDAKHRPFFSMKLVNGRTLASLLADRDDPAIERGRYLQVFEQVCQTIAYAHSRDVIHRDIKPANVMVGAFGEVQVVDWGFAKVLSRGGIEDEREAQRRDEERSADGDADAVETVRSDSPGSQSLAGSVLGTPSYMPPEQAQGAVEALDERADVFSLGAILCEILTGKPPYVRQPGSEVMEQAQAATLDDAHERLESCEADPDLVDLARRCLAVDRDQRPRNAGTVAKAVEDHLARAEERTREAQVVAAEARVRVSEERKARRLTMALTASLVILLAAGVTGVFWIREQRHGADQDIRTALAEAREFSADRQWATANEALRRARTGIAEGNGTPETRQEVEQFGRWFARESAAAKIRDRDVRMLERLREIHTQLAITRNVDDDQYAQAFKAYGIDVLNLSHEIAAERIRERGTDMAEEMAFALDDWAGRRRTLNRFRQPERERNAWKHLTQTARLADPHPWRGRLRDAALAADRERLKAIAEDLDPRNLDPRSVGLLAMGLFRANESDTARDVLRTAFHVHPGDFWINYYLGFVLGGGGRRGPWERRGEDPDQELLDEALRHTWIAHGLRPDMTSLRQHLAALLQRKEKPQAALAQLEEALHLSPEEGRSRSIARMQLARLLHDLGDTERARTELSTALKKPDDSYMVRSTLRNWTDRKKIREGVPLTKIVENLQGALADAVDQADIQRELSRAHYRMASWEEAARAAEAALAVNDGDFDARWLLARARVRQGRFAEAARIGQTSMDQGDDNPYMRRVVAEANAYSELSEKAQPGAPGKVPEGNSALDLARLRLRQGQVNNAADLFVAALGEVAPSMLDQLRTGRRGGRGRGGRGERPRGERGERGEAPSRDGRRREDPRDPGSRGRSRRGRGRGPGGSSEPGDIRDAVSTFVRAGTSPDTNPERAGALRQRALTWLSQHLDEVESLQGRYGGRRLTADIEGWLHDVRFASVRDAGHLSRMTPAEAEPWRAAWKRVQQQIDTARGR